jgi:hypothetical protein
VKRTAPGAGTALGFSVRRLLARLIAEHGDERVQPGVQRLDSREAGVDDVHGRQRPRPNACAEFLDGQVAERFVHDAD